MADRHAIEIDRIRCDGFGMCAELLPELIELDDWGYPIVAVGEVPPELNGHARMAVEACPLLAIRLRRRAEARGARLALPAVAEWGGLRGSNP
jgi:ferredoxin